MEDGGERDGVWTGVDGGEGSETGCGRVWTGVRMEDADGCGRGWGCKMEGSETGCGRVWTGVKMEDGGSETGCGRVWTGVNGGEDAKMEGSETGGGEIFRKIGEKRWTEVVDEACFRVSLKHASLWSEIFKKIGVEGVADGDDPGEKGGRGRSMFQG